MIETGCAIADGVGDLDLEPVRQPGRDDVLGDIARGVRRRAVDLGGVLAGECAAAMTGHAAVGVHDDLAAGQAGVGHRPADLEATARVDEKFVVRSSSSSAGTTCSMTWSMTSRSICVVARRPVMLCRNDDRVDAHRLAMRTPPSPGSCRRAAGSGRSPALARLGQAAGDPVRQRDRQRHQLRRLVAGVADHHALVAGAGVVDPRRRSRRPRFERLS